MICVSFPLYIVQLFFLNNFYLNLHGLEWSLGSENFKTVKIIQIGSQGAKIAFLTLAFLLLPLAPLASLPPKSPAKKILKIQWELSSLPVLRFEWSLKFWNSQNPGIILEHKYSNKNCFKKFIKKFKLFYTVDQTSPCVKVVKKTKKKFSLSN